MSLFDVQQLLRRIIDKNTIIVGHSLDTDLKVLQLVHSTIIDTCALFCHPKGLPNKNSLKNLAKDELGKKIQDDGGSAFESLPTVA